jgi:hypothetical protein
VSLPSPANRAKTEQRAQPDGGATDVVFAFCVSCGVVTWVGRSRPVRVRSKAHARVRGLPYSLVSLLFGWWGLPWGVLLTPRAVWANCTGGVEDTASDPLLGVR